MKNLKINGIDLQYKTFVEVTEYGDTYWTEFYRGTVMSSRKKYILFGPVIIEEIPKRVFTIWEDSNNENLTKDWWKTQILQKLELLSRKEELERGELC